MFDDLLSKEQRNRKGKTFDKLGMDSENRCLDLDWYKSCTDSISYKINKMGFRDIDHKSLKEKVFVIGDSFTMGIGQPYEQTWPCLLEELLDQSVVKLSADGASNDWIRAVFDRVSFLQPRAVFVMLSFNHREMVRLSDRVDHLQYDEKMLHDPLRIEQITLRTKANFDHMVRIAQETNFTVIFTAVPEFDLLKRDLQLREEIVSYQRFLSKAPLSVFKKFNDLSRDGYHFGKKTCKEIAKNLYIRYREEGR